MNQLVRTLAVATDAWCDDNHIDSSGWGGAAWEARFAELIVRECIGLLPEDCQSKNGCHTSWVMKEHFGVE